MEVVVIVVDNALMDLSQLAPMDLLLSSMETCESFATVLTLQNQCKCMSYKTIINYLMDLKSIKDC